MIFFALSFSTLLLAVSAQSGSLIIVINRIQMLSFVIILAWCNDIVFQRYPHANNFVWFKWSQRLIECNQRQHVASLSLSFPWHYYKQGMEKVDTDTGQSMMVSSQSLSSLSNQCQYNCVDFITIIIMINVHYNRHPFIGDKSSPQPFSLLWSGYGGYGGYGGIFNDTLGGYGGVAIVIVIVIVNENFQYNHLHLTFFLRALQAFKTD